jgi:hypothetical protein
MKKAKVVAGQWGIKFEDDGLGTKGLIPQQLPKYPAAVSDISDDDDDEPKMTEQVNSNYIFNYPLAHDHPRVEIRL